MANEGDYVGLGLNCADICKALDRGVNGKKLDDLSPSVCEAIDQLTTWVRPVVHAPDVLTLLQNCGGDREEGQETERAQPGFPACPCEK